MNFISICNKHGFTVTEMVQFITDNKPAEAVGLCEMLSSDYGEELTVKEAKCLIDKAGCYCGSCGHKFHKEDIDGGRCTKCLSMISSISPLKNDVEWHEG
jgi:predicted Zn-ribbon and HTH transcriptional regulator